MPRFENLPTEILQQIVGYLLEDVWTWDLRYLRPFIASRSICRKWKASLEHEMFSRPIDCWGWLAHKGATRLHLLHLVISKDTTDGKVLVAAINNGVEYAIMAKGEGVAEDVLASARAQYSRAIIAFVFPGLHVSYPDFLAGWLRDFWGQISRLSFSDDESHALAVLAAAHEGDVPTLDALLSQRRLNLSPVVAHTVLGPLALAIRGGHINAVKFLLARLDSHGDIDRPDAPNFEGDFAIHCAARVGSIPLL